MDILHRREGTVSVISLSGRLTVGETELLRDGFKDRLGAGDRWFVFQMSEVPYLDSAGVAEIVACAKRACESGGLIKLVAAPDSKTRQILRLTGLDRVFEMFEIEREAVASFSSD